MPGGPPPSPPPSLRLSKQTREQVATLKRRTGIRHMNVLCRWALCRSLLESAPPPAPATDTATEIEWAVFAGASGLLWWSLLLERSASSGDSLSASEADALLRGHVARGMSYLVGDPTIKDVSSLGRLALTSASDR
ncbi:DNA sulfur modification protein DndE [Geodermatophilus dictyosporus]|uniref:DNA sulfur modification protein DndE n=2 Tax=Geodermatophilus dictyosporus TaxID=1523247 RepID=A0A1I5U2J3_9ACTN|nr:DNA sulfur modification protein DndE [Geodermatophilus dictyosporus]